MRRRVDAYLVADDASVRRSILKLLERAGLKSREFDSLRDFLRHASSLEPACLICNAAATDSDSLSMLERVKAFSRDFPSILVTRKGDIATAAKAAQLGAREVVHWPVAQKALVASIVRSTERLRRRSAAEVQTAKLRISRLRPRELQVLERLVGGLPVTLIAVDLHISVRTVEDYRARAMKKLGARDLTQLIGIALMAGLPLGRSK